VQGSPPKVSVVIPNRDGATPRDGLTYLEMVLSTLREQTFRDFDVTVVDNGSSDGSVEYLRESWPEVRLVTLSENAGFSAAINRGMEASDGEYVALLNTDLELSVDWLGLLVGELDRDPGVGFVTGKVMSYWERDVIEQVGQELYTCGRFWPRGLDQRDEGQYDEPRRVAIVTAAAALYRRSAIERAGAFDESYFLYCEDADVCLRILLEGYGGRYVPGPAAFHVRGGTVSRASDSTRFYLTRNALITLLKDLPASILLRSLPKIGLYQLHLLREARTEGSGGTVLRAWGAFVRSLPATLRKRRRVQRRRQIDAGQIAPLLISEYPLPLPRLGERARLRRR
jgi:GT2 family glycosyltransferase